MFVFDPAAPPHWIHDALCETFGVLWMVTDELPVDLNEILLQDVRTAEDLTHLRSELCRLRHLRDEAKAAAEGLAGDPSALGKRLSKGDTHCVRGVLLWLLGQLEDAEPLLADSGDAGAFELGWCRLEIGLYDSAIEVLKPIADDTKDPRHGAAALLCVEADTNAGRSAKSLKDLEKILDKTPTADAYYQLGLALDGEARCSEAVDAYEQAVTLDPDHYQAIFRLGYVYVLAGDPDTARGHYERLAEHHTLYPTALINLGVLYEDEGRMQDAVDCYKRVLRACPTHRRARLYYRDAVAAMDMFYDPEEQKKRTRQDEILGIPISDFELSVRSRNCLAKMNILFLGDLVQKTEEELLAYKNFGETSLTEISEMLTCKGLSLASEGDGEDGVARKDMCSISDPDDAGEPDADSDDILRWPTIELQLSVRCRKCLERLNINTVGELTRVTEDELLSVRNFGRTSLDEIRTKLGAHGLALSDGTGRGL